MPTLDLTVQVFDLPPAITLEEMYIFFSYCGTVEKIQFYGNVDNKSVMALVTFRQPYAFRTALLLDDAVFAGQRIRIVISKDVPISPILSDEWTNGTKEHENHGFVPSLHGAIEVVASTSGEMLRKSKMCDTCSEEHISSGVMRIKNEQVSGGAVWLFGLLNKASKFVSNLGTTTRQRRQK